MGKDYYAILGVSKNSTDEEIKKAYKKLALKWHPDRNPDNKEKAEEEFKLIGEAFDTLKDPEKRKTYDMVGEEGLHGMPPEGEGAGGGMSGQSFRFSGMPGAGGGQTFHFTSGNANDIFKQFFGTDDPFEADRETDGFPGGGFPGGGFQSFMFSGGGMPGIQTRNGAMRQSMSTSQAAKKPEPVHHTLSIPLDAIYTGTTKRVKISKKIRDGATGQLVNVSKDLEINVKPGWKDGTKITFENEGDEIQPGVAQDIVFEIKSKPHIKFTRENDDLIYKHDVSLVEAIEGFQFTLTTLDNRQLQIKETKMPSNLTKIISGEGMPNNKKRTRGDLKIKYNIIFPDLSDSQRHQISSILRNASSHSSRK